MKTRIILGIFVMLSLCANVNAQQQRQRSSQPQNTQRQQVNKPQQQKPVHMHSEKTCIIPNIHYDAKQNYTFIKYYRNDTCEGYIHAICNSIIDSIGNVYNLNEQLEYKAGPDERKNTKWFRVGKGDYSMCKAIIRIPNKNSSGEDKKEKIPDVIKKNGLCYCPNTKVKCGNNLSTQVVSETGKSTSSGKTIIDYYICEKCGLKSKHEY